MVSAKIAITIDRQLLAEVDRWVTDGEFHNRSQAFQEAVRRLKDAREKRARLLLELTKLDPVEERELADETLTAEVTWPGY